MFTSTQNDISETILKEVKQLLELPKPPIDAIYQCMQRMQRLCDIAMRDALTGLYNRTYWEQWIKTRKADECVIVAMIDINKLKPINDTEGHHKGDVILAEAANKITACCRKMDILFRIGGDEFFLILPEIPQNKAEIIAMRLSITLKEASQQMSHAAGFAFGVSMGAIAQVEHLKEQADQAMYQHKLEMKGA